LQKPCASSSSSLQPLRKIMLCGGRRPGIKSSRSAQGVLASMVGGDARVSPL
jgi:hypothetical protein